MPLSDPVNYEALYDLPLDPDAAVVAAISDDYVASVLDFYACSLWGKGRVGRVAEFTPTTPDSTQANVWWTGERTSRSRAAVLNLLAGTVHDIDSVHYAAGGHAAAFLVPSIESYEGHTDANRRRAFVAGLEGMVRFGTAFAEPLRKSGYHPTPIIGGVGVIISDGAINGDEAEVIQWALELFVSTYRSAYYLTGSAGRQFQLSTAMAHASACLAEGRHSAPRPASKTRRWWKSLDWIPEHDRWSYGTRTGPWQVLGTRSAIKSAPICSHFDTLLQVVADLAESVDSNRVSALTLEAPRHVLMADRNTSSSQWVQPFNLRYNAAQVWTHRSLAWHPEPDLNPREVHRIAACVQISENSGRSTVSTDGYIVSATATLDDGEKQTRSRRVFRHGVESQVGIASEKLKSALDHHFGHSDKWADLVQMSEAEMLSVPRKLSIRRPLERAIDINTG